MSTRRTCAAAAVETGAVDVPRLEQVGRFGNDRGRHLPQRREVVQYPERTAVSRGDEIAFLDSEIVHRDDRQVAAQSLPAGSVVEAQPRAALSPGVQQTRPLGILANDAHELSRRDAVGDELPRRPVVGRPVDVRAQVVHLIMIGRDIRRSGVEVRRLDDRNAAPFGKSRRSHIGPRLSGISRDVHQTVVGPRPDNPRRYRRLGNGEHRRVVLHRCLVLGDRTAGRTESGGVVASEVGADRCEALPVVGGFEDDAAADVQRVWVVR